MQIYGLTTAAGIWLTAAVGIAAGLGREASAMLTTFLAFGILALVPHGESQLRKSDDKRGLKKETSPSSDGYVRPRQSEEPLEYDER